MGVKFYKKKWFLITIIGVIIISVILVGAFFYRTNLILFYLKHIRSPEPCGVMVITDKERYSIGETIIITVKAWNDLDVASTSLVHGEVLEQIPFTKGPVETSLYSFERKINLPPHEDYQFVEYYTIPGSVTTTDFFTIVVEAENASNIAFFEVKSLMGLDVEAPTSVAQDEPFTVSIRVSNKHKTRVLSDIKASLEPSYELRTEEPLIKIIPSLQPGQSEVLTWNIVGTYPGYTNLAFNVASENGGTDNTGTSITVLGYPEPLLKLSAPSPVNIGEKFDVTAEIENVGGLPAKGVIVTLLLPSGLLTKESLNKTIDEIQGHSTITVTWPVESSEGCSYWLEAMIPDWNKSDIADVEVIDESSYRECFKYADIYGGIENVILFKGTKSKGDCYKIEEEELKEKCIKVYLDALNKILNKEIEYSGMLDYYEEKDVYSICGNCFQIGHPYERRKAVAQEVGGPCCCCYWLRSENLDRSRYKTQMDKPLTIRGIVQKTKSASQEGNCSISYGCDRLFFEVEKVIEK